MAHFPPQAGSPDVNPFQIIGAVYTLADIFNASGVRYAIEGQSALLTEIQCSNSPNHNLVYMELTHCNTSLHNMTIEAWVHTEDMHKLSACFPHVQLPGEGSPAHTTFFLRARTWTQFNAAWAVPLPFCVHLRFSHEVPDIIDPPLFHPGPGLSYVKVKLKTFAETLLDYLVAIVQADPASHNDWAEIELAPHNVHLMGLIIRTQFAYDQLQSSDFSINLWRHALRCLVVNHHLPRSLSMQVCLDAVRNVVSSPTFAPWAAAADTRFEVQQSSNAQ
ncbi:hypothetical protein JCM10296v2_002199 [Rhodotorula toruloides]